jgi:DNA-binding LacI/PurR family transcriptional regulator
MEVIAARYDVSVNTARMALVVLQHEGWVRLRHGSGCYVSRPEATNPQPHIAILSEYNVLRSPRGAAFYPHVMDELRLFLKAKGQSSRLYIGHVLSGQPPSDAATCSEFLEDLAFNRISGIAALASVPLFSWTEEAKSRRIPIVGMNGLHFRFNGAVDPDFSAAIHDSIVRLVGCGRCRPALIGWNQDSLAAFNTVIEAVGLTPNPAWCRISLPPLEPGAGWSDFREVWATGKDKPDCVIFGDDVLFQDAVPAIQSLGVRIPDDLEIVVLANKGIPLPQLFPFTRHDCDPAEFAAVMGTMLLQFMAGQPPEIREVNVPYRLAEEPNDEGVASEAARERRTAARPA